MRSCYSSIWALSGIVVAASLAIPASRSLAALVPLSQVPDSDNNGKIDLADVIASGGFTLGDKAFTFNAGSYTPSGSSAPAASDIAVSDASLPGVEAIKFGFGWFTINGINMDSRIDYAVSVTDPNPSTMIDAVDLSFNPVSSGTAFASVAETITDPVGNFLALLSVNSDPDGSGPLQATPATSTPILPTQREILVDKDIQLISAPSPAGGPLNVATVSFVDNSYHQTPEPVSAAVLGLASMMLIRRRRSA
jgi:hypothetical protein